MIFVIGIIVLLYIQVATKLLILFDTVDSRFWMIFFCPLLSLFSRFPKQMLFVTMETDQSLRPAQVLLHAEDVFDHQEEQSHHHSQIQHTTLLLEVFKSDNYKCKSSKQSWRQVKMLELH